MQTSFNNDSVINLGGNYNNNKVRNVYNMDDPIYNKNDNANNNSNIKLIKFFIEFNNKSYEIQEYNNKIISEVINDFISSLQEIQNKIVTNRVFLYESYGINLNKTLFENKIQDGSRILMPNMKTKFL